MKPTDRSPAQPSTHAAHKVAGDEPLIAHIFARLADGQFHSGEELAQALGVSRSAVWKAARSLRD
ncbi:MAG: HTH domain-containing protein, partial [Steroidobacteraceae bacterium]